MKLTAKTIEAMKPTAKRQELKDDGGRGLYLLIQPSGSKAWAVRYFLDGKVRKATLGTFPALGLAEARLAAGKVFEQLAGNVDPRQAERQAAAEAKAQRAATFGAIARRFIADSQHLKSARDIERRLKPIIAQWEDRPIASIRRRDVVELVDAVKAARGPYAGVGALAWIKRVMSWAIEKAEIEASPAVGMKPPAVPRVRERALSDDEMRRVWAACDQRPHPFGNYLKMLLLTGCRRTELATIEWSDVNLAEGTICILASRYKNGKAHLIPLSRQARALVEALPRIGDRYVFTATGRKPLNAFEKRMEWFRALLDPPIAFGLHDLRRTFRTGLSRLRVEPHIAERCLGHAQRGVEKHYDLHGYATEKREAFQTWANFIDRLVADQDEGSNVIPMAR